MTEPDFHRPQQQRARVRKRGNGTTQWLWLVLGIAAIGYGAWYPREHWAAQQRMDATPEPAALPVPQAAPVELAPVVPVPESLSDQPQHPMPEAASGALQAGDVQGLDNLAVEWLGQQAVKFLVMPGLAQHVVATIDNLPRSHAAPRLWPLYPVGGQIVLAHTAQGMQIAETNSARYDAVVGFVTGLAPAQVAQWYQQAYPVLQQAYEDLGYPGQYFNDRVVAVIDHVLQTPEPATPLAVHLVQVQGQVPSQQPWLRYEYADAQWQALSAGQKILLRIGAEHRERVKTYLRAVRSHITAQKKPA